MMPHAKGEFSDEFRRAVVETELQQKLHSEFIASVHSWGTFDGQFLWVMMDFCDGGGLTSRLTTILSDARLRNLWIDQLARGLQHMHSLCVIHRDIKTVSA